jgi:hypothetical protein
MVVDQITDVLEKRRIELVTMLESNRDSMELERQHQLYGAINEIDLFLQTVEYWTKNSEGDIGNINLFKPPEDQKGLFTKIFDDIKSKVKRNQ